LIDELVAWNKKTKINKAKNLVKKHKPRVVFVAMGHTSHVRLIVQCTRYGRVHGKDVPSVVTYPFIKNT